MKELDYGKGYLYAHDFTDAYIPQEYLPDELRGEGGRFYRPTDRGYEKIIGERIEQWRQIREANAVKQRKS
jgi:putative ATPase